MTFKTILACLPTLESVDPVMEAALPLAAANGAHLIGLHVMPEPHVYWAVAAEMSSVVLDAQRAFSEDLAEQIGKRFNAVAEAQHIVCEWRPAQTSGYPISDIISLHAASADLLVLAQPGQSEDWSVQTDLPSQVILQAGRPTLVLPHEWTPAPVGKRVAIAWDGRREAARAVFDALPILTRAEEVSIVTIDEDRRRRSGSVTPAHGIAMSLQRHGIDAAVEARSRGDGSIGEALLLHAQDHDSDLMVMGCYGHARYREMVFGGATRDILELARLPVLMSH